MNEGERRLIAAVCQMVTRRAQTNLPRGQRGIHACVPCDVVEQIVVAAINAAVADVAAHLKIKKT